MPSDLPHELNLSAFVCIAGQRSQVARTSDRVEMNVYDAGASFSCAAYHGLPTHSAAPAAAAVLLSPLPAELLRTHVLCRGSPAVA